MQTAPSKVRRVVGFNASVHPRIQLYQDSKTPVLLKDVIIKQDESDWLFHQQSTAYPCANSDISFQYEEQPKPETNYQPIPSTDATIGQVSTIKANQRVNVSGTLSLGDKKPKEVMIKSTQKNSSVKEDCILEDDTGAILFHIWSPLIDQVKTNKSYKFTNLTVKNFQGSTFLSTSPLTTITNTTQSLATLFGPQMLESPEKETTVPNFKFVSKLTIFSSCQVCKKRLYDLSSTSTKCQQCGTRQRTADCSREASIKLCILQKDDELWLTAFTNEISKLLKPTSLTLHDTVEDIEDAIMNLQDITIKYNIQKNIISDILLTQSHEKAD